MSSTVVVDLERSICSLIQKDYVYTGTLYMKNIIAFLAYYCFDTVRQVLELIDDLNTIGCYPVRNHKFWLLSGGHFKLIFIRYNLSNNG